jgi:hypothetical protein
MIACVLKVDIHRARTSYSTGATTRREEMRTVARKTQDELRREAYPNQDLLHRGERPTRPTRD